MKSSLQRLDHENAALRKRLHDATTRTLTQNAPAGAALLEKESEELFAKLRENERETERLNGESERLTAVLSTSDDALFRAYSERMKRYLKSTARDKCRRIFELLQTLTLGEQGLHAELAHPNSRFGSDAIVIVRDKIPLPGILLLKSKAFLARLYCDEKLSTNAIARRINVGQSTVSDAIQRHGLAEKSEIKIRHPQHVPFGFDFQKGRLIRNQKEQQTIRLIQQLHSTGLSLREIAAHLNRKFIPTKRRGVWDATTVRRLLARSSS